MANFGKHTGHKGFGNYYVNPETPGHLWPGSLRAGSLRFWKKLVLFALVRAAAT